MATRFYLRNSAQTTGISPTPDAGWEDTSALVRAIASVNKSGDAIATVTFTDADATAKDILFRQYVSPPLTPGQTITGAQALSFVVRASEVNANNNLFTALGIRILASDGTTVQKTVLAVTQDNTEIVLTTLTNRNLTATSAATNYTTVAGDRLVIEIGYGGDPSGLNTHSGSLSLGDNAGSDLTANDTGTAANNPWVELADTLTFQQYAASGGATSEGAAATATGKVIPKASLTTTGQTPTVKIVTLIKPAAASLTTTRSTPIAKTVLRPVQASGGDGNAHQNYQTAKANGVTSIALNWNYGIPKIGHVYYAIVAANNDARVSSPSFLDNAGNTWSSIDRHPTDGTLYIYSTRATATLPAGSTWTITYSTSSSGKFIVALIDVGSAANRVDRTGSTASGGGQTITVQTSAVQRYGRVSAISTAYMVANVDDALLTYPSDTLYVTNTGVTDGGVMAFGVSNETTPSTNVSRTWTFSNPDSQFEIAALVATVPFGIGTERETPKLVTTLYPAAASLTLTGETPVVTTGGGGTTDYEYSASGGITSGGAATTSATSAYAYTASGGATSGGAATTSTSAAYTYTASGGVTSGGAATTTIEAAYAYSGSGGATSGGAATTAAEYHYAYDASGGATSGGAADTEYTAAGATSVSGEVATADAAGVAPTMAAIRTVSVTGEVATATADAPAPTISVPLTVSITGVAATATAAAVAPTITGQATTSVSGAVAAAGAAAPAPTITAIRTASITAVVAEATGSAVAPSVTAQQQTSVTAVVATAGAAAVTPSVQIARTVTSVVATASATAPAPTITTVNYVSITASAAVAAAAAIVARPMMAGTLGLGSVAHNTSLAQLHPSTDTAIAQLLPSSSHSIAQIGVRSESDVAQLALSSDTDIDQVQLTVSIGGI